MLLSSRLDIFFVQPTGVEINGQLFSQLPRQLHTTLRHKRYDCAGMIFETFEEQQVAELLLSMNIRFMHHICFPMDEASVAPDFTLDRLFLWHTKPSDPHHGKVFLTIEVKRTPEAIIRHMRKYQALECIHGIPTILLTAEEILPYVQAGALQAA